MAYSFSPQPQYPLLDDQYNPTGTLRSFSDAYFNYLDTYYEPKGTQLLEPEKMNVIFSLTLPKEEVALNVQFGSVVYDPQFLAFQIETIFNAHGPSVTRAGFLAYLRSEIMSDPDTACKNFNSANQVMRLGPPFVRSQFPRVAEPRAKELMSYVQTRIDKDVQTIRGGVTSEEEELNALKIRLALEQQGMQAAIDLIDGPRYCYNCRRRPCTCSGILGLI
ncbi:hypothetical protein BX616_001553 [Lobosporangium transversale]|uniref:DUF7514 domain-containing protein n=1 Tax=Lobosporangium transversale TaxID=64571 RepID=A0A1Y2GM83_9FUNG|nr:hypothetical protein BCR41DRAFT_357159 [Lobosporangium transversale]KAF9917253.1 hypothetical protein BX616_001553 [Lobosporangium transversale]ORZ11403.1 hypothetical protein BCR41DRAFT_357159 [Lobosporangium transversale]|eukprot:XP_021879718.1 hypothetical protein BCR41DRAFT_357159 [Lobosporangium transversale]